MTPGTLVAIAGWAHTPQALEPLGRALEEHADVSHTSTAQLLGQAVDAGSTGSAYAQALTRNIRDMSSPPVLLGWSTGAMIALETALMCPEAVAGLVLISGTARFCRDPDYPHGSPEPSLYAMMVGLERDRKSTLEVFFRQVFGREEGRTSNIARAVASARSIDPLNLAHDLEYLRYADLR